MVLQRPETPGTSKSKSRLQRTAMPEESSMLKLAASFFKKATVVLAVWAAGYYKFSASWLILGLLVYVWRERQQAAKRNAIAIAQEIARDERGAILARVEDLPSWVYFPDVERAEWVNKIINQLWPYIGEYVRKLLRETVEPKIKASLPAGLGSFRFSRIDLGDIPPRIGGVKVYTSQTRRDEIYIDLEINYASDSNLAVEVKGMNFGVRDLTLRGTLRIIFRPLITKVPLIGGLTVFFLNNPELDFNLTNLANALDLPGLSELLHSIVQDQIAEVMVLPNRIPVQIADNVDIRKLRYPLPQGVLRVHIIEANDLTAADINLIGKNKSDPYAIATVGAQTFQTAVIPNSLTPVWDQVFEYVIDERDGQLLKVDLKDHDKGNKDDNLGSTTMDIAVICQKGNVEEWLPLEEVKQGKIHLNTTWLYLSSDPMEFARVQENTNDENILNTALLVVHLDSAVDLPRGSRTLQEPSPFVLLTVGQVTKESSVRALTTDPRWEQNFRFFVANPNHQSLDVEVRDFKTKKEIGEMTVHLKNLLKAEQMMMERKFPLKTSEPNSALYMTVILRILTPVANPEWMESEFLDIKEVDSEGKSGSTVSPPAKPAVAESESSVDTVPATPDQEGASPSAPGEEEKPIPPFSSHPDSSSDVRLRKPTASSSPSVQTVDERGEFGLGRMQLTLRYSMSSQQLIIVIHKIINLMPAEGDSKGLADPYIKLNLLADKESKGKFKTHVIKDNLNPVFDAKFECSVSAAEVSGTSLEIAVRNETGLFSSSQKLLGMALVDLSSLDTSRTVTQWLDLAPQEALKASTLTYDG